MSFRRQRPDHHIFVASGKPVVRVAVPYNNCCGPDQVLLSLAIAGQTKELFRYPSVGCQPNQALFNFDSAFHCLPPGRYDGRIHDANGCCGSVQFIKEGCDLPNAPLSTDFYRPPPAPSSGAMGSGAGLYSPYYGFQAKLTTILKKGDTTFSLECEAPGVVLLRPVEFTLHDGNASVIVSVKGFAGRQGLLTAPFEGPTNYPVGSWFTFQWTPNNMAGVQNG